MAKSKYTTAAKYGRRYPWGEWFALGTFTLAQGRDYSGRTDTFAQHIRNMASRKGYTARIEIADDLRSLTATLTKRE